MMPRSATSNSIGELLAGDVSAMSGYGKLDSDVEEVVAACSDRMRALGVTQVVFLFVTPTSDIHRLGFKIDEVAQAYMRSPILSFIEPPTAAMLETETLPHVHLYVPSLAHQLHTFVIQVCCALLCCSRREMIHAAVHVPLSYHSRGTCHASFDLQNEHSGTTNDSEAEERCVQEKSIVSSQYLQRAFVRTVIRRSTTPALLSALYQAHAPRAAAAAVAEAESVLSLCIDELHRLDSQNAAGPAVWAQIFTSVLPQLPLEAASPSAAAQISTALRSAAAQSVARHASALRGAAVAEWVIKMRARGSQDSNGPRGWRVVISLPSGPCQTLVHRRAVLSLANRHGSLNR
jgi:hypothetical protein